MQRFLNALKAQSASLDGAQAQPRFAIVTSVDPERYAARVALQPENVVTGWLPILTSWVGAGWGIACPPAPGDQVLVVAQEGHADHGVILGGSYNDAARAPNAPVGEFWLVHQSGSSIKLVADGTVRIQGDLHVSGDVFDHHGSLDAFRRHYNAHGHPDASAPPNPTD